MAKSLKDRRVSEHVGTCKAEDADDNDLGQKHFSEISLISFFKRVSICQFLHEVQYSGDHISTCKAENATDIMLVGNDGHYVLLVGIESILWTLCLGVQMNKSYLGLPCLISNYKIQHVTFTISSCYIMHQSYKSLKVLTQEK